MLTFDVPRSQFHVDQMVKLREWCELYRPKVIVEVGSWLGKSTSVLGQYAKDNGGIVLAIDWWEDNRDVGLLVNDGLDIFDQFKCNMKELGLDKVVMPIKLSSEKAARLITNGSIDMIFLDGDHRYDSIAQDLHLWVHKLKPGGLFCGHDFEAFDYDEQYIHQDVHDHKHHGVIKAVTNMFPNVKQEERMWMVGL